ncbi:MAG: TlpA family protein disulfide reductase [Acidobacteria bacterium]|nr:TlpA family protein disulfide reductase [Acidobacteriota bacterium]
MRLRSSGRLSIGLALLVAGAALASSCGRADGGLGVAGGYNVLRYDPGNRRAVPGFSGPRLAESYAGEITRTFLSGRVAVVNFWGSWCGPCREEEPRLRALWKGYAPKGVRFLGVDVRDAKGNALAFVEEFGVPYPSVYNPDSSIAYAFRVAFMPTTYVVDRRGRIAAKIVGALRTEEDLARILDRELG